jgi:hypothetical protein
MKYYFFIFSLFIQTILSAQSATNIIDKKQWQQAFSVTGYAGSVWVHTQTVKSVQGAKPWGFAFEFSKQMIDSGTFNICSSYPRKGISLSYFDFGTKILGQGYMASYFLQPTYKITERLLLQFRGDVGLAYLTNPFDSIKNPTNKNYSLHINPYLHFGIGLSYRIGKHLAVELNESLHHISNGHFYQPNAGLNWTTTSLTLSYYPNNNILPKYIDAKKSFWKPAKPKLDIGFMYVPKQGYDHHWQSQRLYSAGIFTQISQQIGRMDAVSFGLELYHNEMKDDETAPANNSQPSLLSAAMIGNEFLLGRIIFSIQVGAYLTKHPAYYSDAFTRWGLRYKLNHHWFTGFNLKVHEDEADFIDLRLQYRF